MPPRSAPRGEESIFVVRGVEQCEVQDAIDVMWSILERHQHEPLVYRIIDEEAGSMGAGASVGAADSGGDPLPAQHAETTLRKLPEAVEEAVYGHEKFPLVVDPSEQAGRFFKYQTGTFISMDDPVQSMAVNINRALVGAFRFGRTLTLKFNTLEGVTADIFTPGLFPIELLDRGRFFTEEVWRSVLNPSSIGDDTEAGDVTISSEFTFIVVTQTEYVPQQLFESMRVVRVVDRERGVGPQEQDPMEQIAELFGAKEVVRNSTQLVEAAFDGDLEELRAWVDKGYHLESYDGRKHTALSEAACQGHLHVAQFLLDNGADPNSLSDTGRSALWRASFNGHLEVASLLLNAGASPDHRDRVSMESAFDVAQSEELREMLGNWDMTKTEALIEQRRRVILASLESRIKTSAEREFFAKNLIRKELVEKASSGDVEGVSELLQEVAREAQASGSKPRASVEVRNDSGQSLLSIAAQSGYFEMAEFLLSHYKK
ncbi:ankyrin repeat-containing domain protein, partial [Ochromonadaceae sp. CCMP2298]